MIFQNTIVRFIAFFIPVKDMRENFLKSYSRKTKFAKLREDNKRLFKQIKQLAIENNTIKQEQAFLKKMLMNYTWLSPLEDNPKIYLSIACMAKNEGRFLKEWIEYHRIVGVERFYFYDNESSDNTKEILDPYIQDGIVIYRYVVGRVMLSPVYQDAILKARGQSRWLAIVDLDEFIVPKEKDSVPEFLKDYEQYPAVGINRMQFDHNGHKIHPTEHGGLVTANYTRVPKDPEHHCRIGVKSIVNPNEVVYVSNPHYYYCKNASTVSEDLEPCGHLTKYYPISKIQINHYAIRSIEDGERNKQRGDPWHRKYAITRGRNLDPFKNIETTNDYAIQKYLPKLKEVMGVKD